MADSEQIGRSSAFGRLLGLEIVSVGDGEAVLRLPVREDLLNLHGKLHGGVMFSLLDIAMGQASHSLLGGQPGSVTLECKVNYLRAIGEGEVTCRAWVIHPGRRTHVLEAEVCQEGRCLAKAQATFIVL